LQAAVAKVDEMGGAASRIPGRRCVYTALVGNYERLNEQPIALRSDIPFICFTDDPNLRSETWQVRPVACALARDFPRSQREIKLRPHKYLPDFEASLYIDSNILLTERPEAIFERYFPASGLALARHSFRRTVGDEFVEVYNNGLDDPGKFVEQLDHYLATCPDILDERPFWGGLLLCDLRSEPTRALLELWFTHVLRYSRRDQLAFNYVARQLGFAPDAIEIDNHTSWFHRWPLEAGRIRDKAAPSALAMLSPLAPMIARIRASDEELHGLRRELKRAKRASEGGSLKRRAAKVAATLKGVWPR
jgi:hypothetical protein